jgi:hypothetical protein
LEVKGCNRIAEKNFSILFMTMLSLHPTKSGPCQGPSFDTSDFMLLLRRAYAEGESEGDEGGTDEGPKKPLGMFILLAYHKMHQ